MKKQDAIYFIKFPSLSFLKIVLLILIAVTLTKPAWSGDDSAPIFRLPLIGADGLQTGASMVSVVNQQDAQSLLEDSGLLLSAKNGVRISIENWDAKSGTIAFWIQARSWTSETSFQILGLIPSGPDSNVTSSEGWFYLRKIHSSLTCIASATDLESRSRLAQVEIDFMDWNSEKWHHIAVSWKVDEGFTLYLDGNSVGHANRDFTWPQVVQSIILGGQQSMENNSFLLRDLRVFAELLDDRSIQDFASETSSE